MPRTNYLPDRHTPIGYAMTYQKSQYEDKPTVEVDLFADGLQAGLIEAVCVALETWDPVFDHWEAPRPMKDQSGNELSQRKIAVFRGRHAHKVLKFRDDIFRYTSAHPTEQEKNVFVKIASKYVHIRPKIESNAALPHQDITHYQRDVIRPIIRRSDPEWDRHLVLQARKAIRERVWGAQICAHKMLVNYDRNHGTMFAPAFISEIEAMEDDDAPDWEQTRLIAFYVQDIVDSFYRTPEQGLYPAKKVAPKKVRRPV